MGAGCVALLASAAAIAAGVSLPKREVELLTPCKVTDPDTGEEFDFSSLAIGTATQPFYSVRSKLYDSYKVYFNVCAAIRLPYDSVTNPDVCVPENTTTCEMQTTNGITEASEQYGATSHSKMVWNTENITDGVEGEGPMFESTNGECSRSGSSTPITSRVFFACDPNAQVPVPEMIDDNYWDCYVNIKMRTALACKGQPPSPPPSGDLFRCVDNECVKDEYGVSIEACEDACGVPRFRCKDNMCVPTPGGVSKEECDAVCG